MQTTDERDPLASPEAEQQLLGAVLLDNDRVPTVQGYGGKRLFAEPVHALIFERVAGAYRDDILASPVTLRQWADQDRALESVGGGRYLLRMAGASVAGNRVDDYCEILDDLRRKRLLSEAMDRVKAEVLAGDRSADQIAARLEMVAAEVEPSKGVAPVTMMQAVTEAMQKSLAAYAGEDAGGVRTGIKAIDEMLSAMQPGELILLGGRPSMGKTALAVSIAVNAAVGGRRVGFASYEMTPDAVALRVLAERMSSSGHSLPYRRLRDWSMLPPDEAPLKQAARDAAALPVAFVGREYQDAGSLLAGARRIRAKLGGLDLLVVDYVQLMRAAEAKGRYETITEISTALKHLAVKLGIPVLALSQLSRQVEQREDKRPQLADLRESGQLEQDADAVMFVYRDEYYLERKDTASMNDEAFAKHETALSRARRRMEVIIAKQRQGPTGVAAIGCAIELNRVFDL